MKPSFHKRQAMTCRGSKCEALLACQAVTAAILLLPLLLAVFWPGGAAAQAPGLSDLPITFPAQAPEIAAYFGEIARPGDLASVFPERLFLLSQAEPGAKMVAFRSWADAQSQLDGLTAPVGWIMYNPEHWDLTPEDEQQDLGATAQAFAEEVRARGMQFMFAPDRQYAELYLGQVAPHIDAVMLQGQRLQHDPQTFASWVLGMVEVAKASNPEIQVFVQVGTTRGTAEEMYTALETVAGTIDGIAIWSMPRTQEILEEFMTLLREAPPEATATPEATAALAAAPSSTPTALPPTAAPTELPTSPAPTATLESLPTPTSQSEERPAEPTEVPAPVQPVPVEPLGGWVTSVLLFAGGMGVGLVLGFVLGWGLRRGS